MMTRYKRIFALIKKEILSLFKDPKSRLTLIGPPILQLFIFTFAATLEVKNISLVITNEDMGKHSFELVQRFSGSKYFTKIDFVKTNDEFKNYIDNQKAILGVHFQQDFSRKIELGDVANLQIIIDGRRSNAAQIAYSYILDIINNYQKEITQNSQNPNPKILVRNWFNNNLQYIWSVVPSLVCILSMLIALVVTSLSVARERELGTFDQILVSPLLPFEILVGKTIPAVIIGICEGLLIWLLGLILFKTPFEGSFALLLLTLFVFILSIVGVGLFISSISKTQQQAILGTFIFMVPAVTLSGYASPVENMPEWLQVLTWFNPLKHALIAVKLIFLKNVPLQMVLMNIWPMMVIGCVIMPIAGWFFSKRLE